MNIRIDQEFKALIPPLSAEELAQLEKNISKDGCRDPLTLWDGVLLDGHNRHAICTRMSLPFTTVSIALPNREAALDWIDANQLGRRNLSPDAFKLLLGRRYSECVFVPRRVLWAEIYRQYGGGLHVGRKAA